MAWCWPSVSAAVAMTIVILSSHLTAPLPSEPSGDVSWLGAVTELVRLLHFSAGDWHLDTEMPPHIRKCGFWQSQPQDATDNL